MIRALLGSGRALGETSKGVHGFRVVVDITRLLVLVISCVMLRVANGSVLAMTIAGIVCLLVFVPHVAMGGPFVKVAFKCFFGRALEKILVMAYVSALMYFTFLSNVRRN